MAIEAKPAEVDGKKVENVKELVGLPSDSKERASVLQSIGAAAKREGTVLVRRGKRAFIAKDGRAVHAIKAAVPVARSSKYGDLVKF